MYVYIYNVVLVSGVQQSDSITYNLYNTVNQLYFN